MSPAAPAALAERGRVTAGADPNDTLLHQPPARGQCRRPLLSTVFVQGITADKQQQSQLLAGLFSLGLI